VRSLIARRIAEDARPEAEKPIRQALVPTQEVVEIKNGKKVNVERKIYPGYVLVEMDLNQETIHTINGIQGVIKFVGTGRLPMPLRPTRSTGCWASKKRPKKKSPPRRFRSSWARSSRSPRDRSRTSAAPSRRSCPTRGKCGSRWRCSDGRRRSNWIICSSRRTSAPDHWARGSP